MLGAGYATGRLRFVQLGARAVGVIEDEFDALTEALRRERDQLPPAACPDAHVSIIVLIGVLLLLLIGVLAIVA